ncbi:DUF3883 domain-containing protein [Paenibacillus sp. 28ISP30-2]|nr:DUF3883 domain-containing protein [Paenibacillus sp. 28ISP30-2]
MSISVGILYSSQKLLIIVRDNQISANELLEQFKKIYVAGTSFVIDTCKICGWVEVNISGCLQITKIGKEILSTQSSVEQLRAQLKYYIYSIKPRWSRVLHYGRTEAVQHFPQEIVQCFEEAELLSDLDKGTVDWWDTLGAFSRTGIEEKKASIGREGELLSLQYEEKRLGIIPSWKSFESNFVGFDILSKVSGEDSSNLSIEVKATTNNSNRITFFITENEWHVASLTKNYIFHLWTISREPILYILTPDIVGESIPSNQGRGRWETVRIEYNIDELELFRKS